MVAIVGTRQPTPEAMNFAEDLAKGIVGQGFAVVSGWCGRNDSALTAEHWRQVARHWLLRRQDGTIFSGE